MDGRRFDQLARSFSGIGTRRGLVRLLVTLPLTGGILALVEGEAADAARHRKRRKKRRKRRKRRGQGSSCRPACADGRACCGGACCQPSQVCGADDACCTPLPEDDACAAAQASGQVCGAVSNGCGGSYICDCPNGTCQTCTAQDTCVPANDGVRCDAGNPCSTDDTCDAGVCSPGRSICEPAVCKAPGICDPATGACTYANDPDGTGCPDDGLCCAGRCFTATTCLPTGGVCGEAFAEPPCACSCCSGDWVGAADGGLCL